MSELIITIHRDERDWPATTRRTRMTGYGVGVHSMTSEHWAGRVEHVGRPRIDAAIRRKDLRVVDASTLADPAAATEGEEPEGGER